MDYPDTSPRPTARKPRTWRTVALVSTGAFLVGLAAMTLAMQGYQRWFAGTATPQPVAAAPAVTDGAGFSPRAPLTASGSASDLETLSVREAALTGRITELEARLAAVGGAAQAASGNASRAEGLLVAFAARRALDRGLGLGYIEGQLRDRFGSSQPRAVATVVQAARQPVTLEDLREGVEAIAPQLATGGTTYGWWASLRRELSDLVVIRRDGAPSPRPSDRLERAGRMLDGGQVEAALAEIARLPGAESGNRWIAAAKRYIDARRALDTIETAAILGQGRDPYAVAAVAAPAPVAEPAADPVADPVTGAPLPAN